MREHNEFLEILHNLENETLSRVDNVRTYKKRSRMMSKTISPKRATMKIQSLKLNIPKNTNIQLRTKRTMIDVKSSFVKSKTESTSRVTRQTRSSKIQQSLEVIDLTDSPSPLVPSSSKLNYDVVDLSDVSLDNFNDRLNDDKEKNTETKKILSSSIKNCPVCLDSLVDKLAGTFCGHVYHFNCIKRVLVKGKYCPVCRSKLTMKKVYRIYL